MNYQNKVSSVLFLLGVFFVGCVSASLRLEANINPAWKFHLGDPGQKFASPSFNDSSWENVALPHTLKECSLYLDDCMDSKLQESFHRHVGCYRKTLMVKNKANTRNYFLHFQGAMQTLELWINGKRIGKYEHSGYDSFHFDITDELKRGANTIAIKVDNQINELTPPDGKKMAKDFILFGGLYRDVTLVSTGKIYVNFPWEARDAGVRITFPEVSEKSSSVKIATTLKNDFRLMKKVSIKTTIKNAKGAVVATLKGNLDIPSRATATLVQNFEKLKNIELWSPESPVLYTAESVVVVNRKAIDSVSTRFGVRSIEFTQDKGFFINGTHLKLQGANRHQTWPYIGNALPNSLHRRDAEIIKASGMNWVRLSHYPHDPDFLDACDELGLLLLEEGPTWMRHNGGAWLNNLYYSFRSMIRRDRNHPSIMVWNACINHSRFNEELGKICEEEDNRPIGAKMPKTPMDFGHKKISGNGALTIEHTGHTYPRGRGELRLDGIDGEWELAKRHLEHVDASYRKTDNSGMAAWAMFDYNTFHNIDEKGIVWHGVCDLTRIPKHSYYWYQSELTKKPMAYVINYTKGKASVFSNCDQVEMFQDTGSGFKSLGKKDPPTDFVLNSPPFDFDVDQEVVALKAVGFMGNEKKTEYIWRKPGLPVAVDLVADSAQIVADGSDLTRIVATIVDAQGTPVKSLASVVYFTVEGKGTIVGTNPAPIRAGKAVVLVRSHYSIGELKIVAASPELKSESVSIACVKAGAHVLFPANLPAFKAGAKPARPAEFAWLSDLAFRFQESNGQRWDRRFGLAGLAELKVGEKTYSHVISANSPAQVLYSLGGLYKKITATLVATDEKINYQVFLDGKKSWSKSNLTKDTLLEVSLEGVQSMRLLATVTDGNKNAKIQAHWADAKLFYGRSARVDTAELFDDTQAVSLEEQQKDTNQLATPNAVEFKTVRGAKKGTYVKSNIVMISGGAESYPITIQNGEYRIYSEPWTSKPGKLIPGDALTLRAKVDQVKTTVQITIGGFKTTFEVVSK